MSRQSAFLIAPAASIASSTRACFHILIATVLLMLAAFAQARVHAQTAVPEKPSEEFLIGYDRRPEVHGFIDEMVAAHGFVRAELEALFARTLHNETVVRLMTPGTSSAPKNWPAYRARFVEPVRIAAGVRFWHTHADTLARAEREYGVPAAIIVGILGVETVFGRNTGSFRVIDALTTLAFDYPNKFRDRSSFFREQLRDYLLFARDNDVDIFSLRGSYAGAIGIPQFMPGSYRRYAIDFDGDGTIDLRNSAQDAIGSVANYLAAHGWQRGVTIYHPARLDVERADLDQLERLVQAGSQPQFTLEEMNQAGLDVDLAAWPARAESPLDAAASGAADSATPSPSVQSDQVERLALIDLPTGPQAPVEYVLGTANFHALTRYNRSYFYAMAVAELGAAVEERIAR